MTIFPGVAIQAYDLLHKIPWQLRKSCWFLADIISDPSGQHNDIFVLQFLRVVPSHIQFFEEFLNLFSNEIVLVGVVLDSFNFLICVQIPQLIDERMCQGIYCKTTRAILQNRIHRLLQFLQINSAFMAFNVLACFFEFVAHSSRHSVYHVLDNLLPLIHAAETNIH